MPTALPSGWKRSCLTKDNLNKRNKKPDCHSEWSVAESRNLPTNELLSSSLVPSSFDSLRSLRMTAYFVALSSLGYLFIFTLMRQHLSLEI